jgi:BirA family biotin operon repressor/biotin-[acetyl-CoA-carboxylase] ligase
MAADGLRAAVEALRSTWNACFYESVESTQDEARAAARAGALHRSVFIADYQRAGRGRHGRQWVAPAGSALLLSMLFTAVTSDSPRPWRWTSLASVALLEAVDGLLGIEAGIKWPNDVMLNDRKVAGVLAETSWNGHVLQAIVGVGVNVNVEASDLVDFPNATSLKLGFGADVDRGRLLTAFIERVDHWLERDPDQLHARWASRLWGRGQKLRLLDQAREEVVVVLGVASDGALRVRLPDGTERRTTTGEILP